VAKRIFNLVIEVDEEEDLDTMPSFRVHLTEDGKTITVTAFGPDLDDTDTINLESGNVDAAQMSTVYDLGSTDRVGMELVLSWACTDEDVINGDF
jgi:hypothetical protein